MTAKTEKLATLENMLRTANELLLKAVALDHLEYEAWELFHTIERKIEETRGQS